MGGGLDRLHSRSSERSGLSRALAAARSEEPTLDSPERSEKSSASDQGRSLAASDAFTRSKFKRGKDVEVISAGGVEVSRGLRWIH